MSRSNSSKTRLARPVLCLLAALLLPSAALGKGAIPIRVKPTCPAPEFARTAGRAEHATEADHATTADRAGRADHAREASHATEADHAGSASHADSADQADEALHAESADTAEVAASLSGALCENGDLLRKGETDWQCVAPLEAFTTLNLAEDTIGMPIVTAPVTSYGTTPASALAIVTASCLEGYLALTGACLDTQPPSGVQPLGQIVSPGATSFRCQFAAGSARSVGALALCLELSPLD